MSEIITIDKQVRELIAEQLAVNFDQVTDTVTFAELGADSLDQVEIRMALEDEFGLEISEADEATLTTARAVIDYVTKAKDAP